MKSISIQKDRYSEDVSPCLKISKEHDVIVLFNNRQDSITGTVIWTKDYDVYELGFVSDAWDIDNFELFNGVITIENDCINTNKGNIMDATEILRLKKETVKSINELLTEFYNKTGCIPTVSSEFMKNVVPNATKYFDVKLNVKL